MVRQLQALDLCIARYIISGHASNVSRLAEPCSCHLCSLLSLNCQYHSSIHQYPLYERTGQASLAVYSRTVWLPLPSLTFCEHALRIVFPPSTACSSEHPSETVVAGGIQRSKLCFGQNHWNFGIHWNTSEYPKKKHKNHTESR